MSPAYVQVIIAVAGAIVAIERAIVVIEKARNRNSKP